MHLFSANQAHNFFNVFSYAGKLIGSAVFCFYKITIDFFSAVKDRFCTNQGTHSSCDLFYKWQSSKSL